MTWTSVIVIGKSRRLLVMNRSAPERDRRGQAGGVGGSESVPAGQDRSQVGGRSVDGVEVQPGQQVHKGAELLRGAVAQRLAEDLRQEQYRTAPGVSVTSSGPEQRRHPATERMPGHRGVDQDIGGEGVHHRAARSARMLATSSSARSVVRPRVVPENGSAAASSSRPRSRQASSSTSVARRARREPGCTRTATGRPCRTMTNSSPRSTRLSRSGSAARAAEAPIDVITQWYEAVPGTL